ncbi:MAG TPA: nitroreductase family protein [Candidatus Hydrothermia bacterium]|nr:nitroreductase family protein [Candidatus Hydrothermae bacterium]HOK23052.1 nitroreductase family protein [Candidatus Hydrothermia bacterium]HOL23688.1 nitroreductase family protein [Candidatus Hydrothermia bacterium]HPO78693.1 nitroreductase family protein [Candidatus Hydrothermia bacterium]HRD23249.1 nitroreductase family protein [Candidatus Hydrothermia bacterium]
MVGDLILKNRSYRRYYEDHTVSLDTLLDLVDLARLSPSSMNLQPLRYILVNTPERCNLIFQNVTWAAYLRDWGGPSEGERPPAYIVMLTEKDLSQNYLIDAGIATQSILLGAVEKGLGGCVMGSLNKDRIRVLFNIPERYEVVYAIAIGKPKESVVIEEIDADGDIRYWRDEKGIHHVPKRRVKDIVLNL